MKVLLVDGAREWRGGQNQILLTALGLRARGHDVRLACRRGGILLSRAREADIATAAVRFGGELDPRAALGLVRIVRQGRPDVVQLNDPPAAGAGLLAARLCRGLKTITTRRVDFHLRGALSQLKYRRSGRVIAVSRAIRGVLVSDGIPEAMIRLVYEGVPDRAAQPGGRAALAEAGIPEPAPVVGLVAALTDHKDPATFVEAAALVAPRVPEAHFVIVGDGTLRPQVEALVRARGLTDRCHLLGFRSDLDRLIPAFSLFCLSSRLEGLGTSLLDAMAFARPIVATAAGGIPEAVEDGVSGQVVPVADPAALAEALGNLLQDPARRDAMGRAGRRRFEERFTAERMVEDTLGVYEELCASARS